MTEQLLYTRAIYGDPEKDAVNRVLNREWLSGGMETMGFEKELADWWGVKHVVSCNSGSSANFLAVAALDLPKGSEVIVPAGGVFPTTISPLVYHGLIPVFCDVDIKTLCLDLDEAESAITSKTSAILLPHTLGFMANMDEVMEIVGSHGLKLMEDTCDAMGSTYGGRKAGTWGDVATCSFYPAHHITTGGEGGAVITNDHQVWRKAGSIRDWGRDCTCQVGVPGSGCNKRFANPPFDHRYYYTNLGMNLKLTEMQAAFGREQIKRVDDFIALRRRNYAILATRLGRDVNSEISPFAFPVMQKLEDWGVGYRSKETVMQALEKVGIQTRTLFGGNILEHPAYQNIPHRIEGDLPNSKRLMDEAFFVGVGPHLTEENMNFIADQLERVLS